MIVNAALADFSIPLRTPVATAKGSIVERVGVVLDLTDSDGRVGRGEVAPLPGWSSGDLDSAKAELNAWVDATLRGGEPAPRHTLAPEVRGGIDLALWALRAVTEGVPLWKAIDPTGQESVVVNALLGGRSPEQLAASAQRAQADGYATLKVKAGMGDDPLRFAALAEVLAPEVLVRLDANGAWSIERAVEMSRLATTLFGDQLEYIEDPVSTAQELRLFCERSPAPVAVDELAGSAKAMFAVLELADAVVLKPALLGGISDTVAVAAVAADAGVDVVISSLLDGPVGLGAWCHLAAALGGSRAHGLGTAWLLDSPAAESLLPRNGRVRLF